MVTGRRTWLKQLSMHTHTLPCEEGRNVRKRAAIGHWWLTEGQRTGLYSTCFGSLSNQLCLLASLVCLSRTHPPNLYKVFLPCTWIHFPFNREITSFYGTCLCNYLPSRSMRGESIPVLLTPVCLTPSICLGLRRCSKINFEWTTVKVNNCTK